LGYSELDVAGQPTLDAMAVAYQRIGLALNEMNRAVGLADPVPVLLAPAVIGKLRFIQGLIAALRPAAAVC
jgi:hypothetical protein